MAKTPKRPRDPNQLAKMIVDLATMDEKERDATVKRASRKPAQIPGNKGVADKS